MRITNRMMQNNALNNVGINKSQMTTLDTQLSTQKKINRPSEDPIIAIRALRLRTSLNEVTQYLEKNIPDANSWLDVTEGALTEADSIISDVYEYCVQGSTTTLSTNERKIISDALKELRSSLYSQGDVDYAGRYVFTGYRTDTSLTFTTNLELEDADYRIKETLSPLEFDYKTVLLNPTDIDAIKTMSPDDIAALDSAGVDTVADFTGIDNETVHRIRLSYPDIKEAGLTISYTERDADGDIVTDANGDPVQNSITPVFTTDESQIPGDDEVLVNTETGELLFGNNVFNTVFNANGNITVEYEKDTFKVGDARPEHYFTCENLSTGMKYEQTEEGQDINYIINFNQRIKVNSEAKDCFTMDMGRDIDEIINAVDATLKAEDKLATLKELKANPNYVDEKCQKNLDSMIEAAQKEVDLLTDTLTKAFESGISNMQKHQENIDIALSDVGNRMSRLELTEKRLKTQKTNFTNLKSKNEDIDLEDVVINYASAELVYNASLTAASKSVRQTLLDFI